MLSTEAKEFLAHWFSIMSMKFQLAVGFAINVCPVQYLYVSILKIFILKYLFEMRIMENFLRRYITFIYVVYH